MKSASVRAKPDVQSALIKTLEAGRKIDVVGKVKGQDWYVVSENGTLLGYVQGEEVAPASP